MGEQKNYNQLEKQREGKTHAARREPVAQLPAGTRELHPARGLPCPLTPKREKERERYGVSKSLDGERDGEKMLPKVKPTASPAPKKTIGSLRCLTLRKSCSTASSSWVCGDGDASEMSLLQFATKSLAPLKEEERDRENVRETETETERRETEIEK